MTEKSLPRPRNEAAVAAVLAIAASISFAAAVRGWSGTADWKFYALLGLGAAFIVVCLVTIAHLLIVRDLENDVRASVMYVTRDEFRKEPPIRGKGPIH